MRLYTTDLVLRLSDITLANDAENYYYRNRDFLAPFEPERSSDFYTSYHHQCLMEEELVTYEQKRGYYFYIYHKKDPHMLIGKISLSNVVWGSFCSCNLGYKLDAGYVNRGLMEQAVNELVRFAFLELGLHRIEGNVMPHNLPSLRVLEKCDFNNEGISPKYLKIKGKWCDHIHMVKLNEFEIDFT